MIDRDALVELAAEANLAPSVHNIQPVRFRLAAPDRIELVHAPGRTLPVGDPTGHDVLVSAGAALEGLVMALGARGLSAAVSASEGTFAAVTVTAGGGEDPLRAEVGRRSSWRGGYRPKDPDLRARMYRYRPEDVTLVTAWDDRRELVFWLDFANIHFLRQPDHRRELLSWMRLSRRHPDYARDGLSAGAMRMGAVQAFGAGIVLGKAFPALDRMGLAKPLTSDGHASRASAFVLFHRPEAEDAVSVGRAFYRRWLELSALGLSICPVSVVSDMPETNDQICRHFKVPAGRRLVSVWKAGVPDGTPVRGARLPPGELVVA